MGHRDSTIPAEDPVRRSLEDALLDDEPVTADERRAVDEARQDSEGFTTEQLRQLLGL